jgi:hypothetical protein
MGTEARCEAAKKGEIQSRTVPTRSDYPGKYRRYWLVDNKERLPEKTIRHGKDVLLRLILKGCFGLLRPNLVQTPVPLIGLVLDPLPQRAQAKRARQPRR